MGKISGGGLPIGAYAGKKEIMDFLAPIGDVYQASTFSGNPVVMQSGIATLKELKKLKDEYPRLVKLTKILVLGLKEEARSLNIPIKLSYYGPMFSLKFEDRNQFSRFYAGMLKQGVYFAPSEFEANFLSFAHSKKDIDNTIQAIRIAMKEIKK